MNGNGRSDAYGNFEGTEILISAESNGKLLLFDIEEGERIEAGRKIGLTDTIPLHLKKKQLEASGNMTLDRIQGVAETGVDFISVGALTHSAPAFDLRGRR